MNSNTATTWKMRGEEVVSCNCAWGCPCQFNANPTHGNCEALGVWEIHEGHYGDVRLDSVRFALIYWWPGAVHEGNGIRQMIIDEKATPEQREVLRVLDSGKQGGAYFEIFSAVAPHVRELIIAPIALEAECERRHAIVHIPNIGEIHAEPIKNPVTGEEHRARIDLPNGFEYKLAEAGNSTLWRVNSGEKLNFEHRNTYAQFAAFDWSN